MTKIIGGIIWRRIVLNASGTARAYGCLSTSFSGLEREAPRRGAFSLYWDSNAFALVSGISVQVSGLAIPDTRDPMARFSLKK